MKLKDKVAIITGGSRGIGFATADKFLQEGATVILTASSQASADKAVEKLQQLHPGATVAGISPDLSNLESVKAAFRFIISVYVCHVISADYTSKIKSSYHILNISQTIKNLYIKLEGKV